MKTPEIDAKVLLSTLWIFVSVNYIYSDVLSSMLPATVKVTQEFLLGAAILLEIPFAMIVLSRVLKYRANRWLNVIAGAVMTLVQISSLFVATPALHYVFFSVIEIGTDLFIVGYALKWRLNPK